MLPEPASSEDIERFKVRAPADIDRLLKSIMDDRSLVTLYSEFMGHFLVTSILDLDREGKLIYLGCASDEAVNQALADSPTLLFSTTQNQVKVQFKTERVERVLRNNESLFQARYPAEALRYQRREYYRLPTQVLKPIKCFIPIDDVSLETMVVDISVGGIGVLSYRQDVHPDTEAIYHGCRLELPDSGTFLVSLSVRATYDVAMKNGVVSHRLGCQFISLPGYVENEIQRYILRAERERRAAKA
jgi:c-di-GMP-binding flagellar brake protein YcgR